MIKKIKSWNILKCVVVKASLEPMPQNLAKTKSAILSANAFTDIQIFLWI